ncbi:MAG: hypothetical protein Q4B67_04505 [Eubacteriales bacterium]|nr:hypothetical protein [Eubacteriales bacterium]
MKKKFVLIMALALMVSSLAGCVPTDKTMVDGIEPDTKAVANVDLDFVQLHNDTLDYINPEPYIFVAECEITGTNNPKQVNVICTLMDEAGEEDADAFAAALLRNINDAAYVQSNEYVESNSSSFGTLWNKYEATISFYHLSDEAKGPFHTVHVVPGEAITLDPDIERYEEEWQKELEIYLRNHEDD